MGQENDQPVEEIEVETPVTDQPIGEEELPSKNQLTESEITWVKQQAKNQPEEKIEKIGVLKVEAPEPEPEPEEGEPILKQKPRRKKHQPRRSFHLLKRNRQ